MDFYVAVTDTVDAVEVDALVCAVPAGDVAEVAADAEGLVYVSHNFVIQIEVLPVGDFGRLRPRRSSMVRKFLESIQWLKPSFMSSTMR